MTDEAGVTVRAHFGSRLLSVPLACLCCLFLQQTSFSERIAMERDELQIAFATDLGSDILDGSQPMFDQYARQVEELLHTGSVRLSLGDNKEAIASYDRAFTLCYQISDLRFRAAAFNLVGKAYSEASEKGKAVDAFNLALTTIREIAERTVADQRFEAGVLAEMADAYLGGGAAREAVQYYDLALTTSQGIVPDRFTALALHGKGRAYADLGVERKALECIEAALAIFQQADDQKHVAMALNSIGLIYHDLGDQEKALEKLNQALPIRKAVGDKQGEAITLSNIGICYMSLGRIEEALAYLGQALSLEESPRDSRDRLKTLISTAAAYSLQGDIQKALDVITDIQKLLLQVNDPRAEAGALNNIAAIYINIGRSEEAVRLLTKAALVADNLEDKCAEGIVVSNIGRAYHVLGEYEKADQAFSHGLKLFQTFSCSHGETSLLANRAELQIDIGQAQKAIQTLNRALTLLDVTENRTRAVILADLGIAYMKIAAPRSAISNLDQSLQFAGDLTDPFLKGWIAFHLAQYWHGTAKPAIAIFFAKQAVNDYQETRTRIGLGTELDVGFLSSNPGPYRLLADLLIQQGRLSDAKDVLDMLKDYEYREYTRGGLKGNSDRIALSPQEEAQQEYYEARAKDTIAKGERRAELQNKGSLSPEEKAELAKLSSELKQSNQRMEEYYVKLYKALTVQGSKNEANENVSTLRETVSSLQRLLARSDTGTVALYTLVFTDHYRVIVITRNATVARDTFIRTKELRQKVFQFLQELSSPQSEPEVISQELYTLLIAPIEEDLRQSKARTLLWSLDDVLRYVPIAALYDGKQYMAERYAGVIIPHGSFLEATRPVDNVNLSGLAMGISKRYEVGFSPLPGVREELEGIVRDPRYPGSSGAMNGTIELDDAFTEKTMVDELKQHYPLVHIASHFVLDSGGDANSFLLLAGKDFGGGGYHLTLKELRTDPDLQFNGVQLLTFSACKTAVSNATRDGLEIDAVGTVARQRGADAVLASLWNVNDASTAKLMIDFYRAWTTSPRIGKAEALRLAQVSLLRGGITRCQTTLGNGTRVIGCPEPVAHTLGTDSSTERSHPYYWAPFILIGDWR